MKKNISINLFGALYNIDDDAYKLLEHYLNSMKQYFSRQEGGEEIADDIEHRVAELLWEKREQGMEAIDITTVKEIISKIGNANEIDETSADSTSEDAEYTAQDSASDDNRYTKSYMDSLKGKRLFRDTREKMIGGVCSGLAIFFGGDVVMWRLSAVLLTILLGFADCFFVLPVLYIVLLVIVPTARSAEDRLRMQGRNVTRETLHEEIISESADEAEPYPTSDNNGCLSLILKLILIIVCLPVIVLLIGIFTIVMFSIIVAVGGASTVFPAIIGDPQFSLWLSGHNNMIIITGLIALLFVLVIPIYCLIHVIRNKSPFRSGTKVGITIAWILCIAVALVSFFGFINQQKYNRHQNWLRYHQVMPVTTTIDMPDDTLHIDTIQ